MTSLLALPPQSTIILGSRSPRRRELIELLVPRSQVRVVPPREPHEAGFDGLTDRKSIEARLRSVAVAKFHDVSQQVAGGVRETHPIDDFVVVCADTIVVVEHAPGELRVLGQPTEADWQRQVADWFQRYYAGRTHWVLTGLAVGRSGDPVQQIVETKVRMSDDLERWLAAYLDTGESQDKAGGYGLQGLGSLFIESVTGSSSNVIGLPLAETAALLQQVLHN